MPDRIAIIVGTRPEAIKLVPVYLELNKRALHVDLISTGQHEQMLQQIFDFFSLAPDIHLKVMQPNQSLSGLTALLVDKLQQCIDVGKYDMLIVQGDTTTAFAGALVGFYNKIPTGALLLVSDQPMVPEGVKTEASDVKVTSDFVENHLKIGIDSLKQLINKGQTVRHLRF